MVSRLFVPYAVSAECFPPEDGELTCTVGIGLDAGEVVVAALLQVRAGTGWVSGDGRADLLAVPSSQAPERVN